MRHTTRLAKLEQAARAQRGDGVRVFYTDDRGGRFYERSGAGELERFYTRAELDQLGADGWQVITVEYIDNWPR